MNTHQREVTIAVCGAVVGIMIGAGSFLFRDASVATLAGSLFTVGTDGNLVEVQERGDVLRKPAVQSFVQSAASSRASSTGVVDSSACRAARDASTTFLLAIDQYVRTANIRAQQGLMDAAQVIVDRYCRPGSASSASSAAASSSAASRARVIDNECGQYPTDSARYTTCVIEQQAGRVYPDPKKR